MTRSEKIAETIERYTRETGMTLKALSSKVVDHYHQTTPKHKRTIIFQEVEGETEIKIIEKKIRSNTAEFKRMLNPHDDNGLRLPVDLEDSILAVLPDVWASNLEHSLGLRRGYIPSPLPKGNDVKHIQQATAKALKEIGEGLTQTSKDAESGVLDEPQTVIELTEAISAITGLLMLHKSFREKNENKFEIKAV